MDEYTEENRTEFNFIANLPCSTWHNSAVQIRIAWLYCTHVFMRLWYVHFNFTAEAENSPLCDWQHGIHRTRQRRQANPRFAGFIICIIELNTRCATSDVNPFKIRCNLQIAKATVNETQ